MNITIPSGAPPWFSSMARQLETMFVQTQPKNPIRLPYFNADKLPAADKYKGHIVYVTDLETIAVSNGVAWFSVPLE